MSSLLQASVPASVLWGEITSTSRILRLEWDGKCKILVQWWASSTYCVQTFSLFLFLFLLFLFCLLLFLLLLHILIIIITTVIVINVSSVRREEVQHKDGRKDGGSVMKDLVHLSKEHRFCPVLQREKWEVFNREGKLWQSAFSTTDLSIKRHRVKTGIRKRNTESNWDNPIMMKASKNSGIRNRKVGLI